MKYLLRIFCSIVIIVFICSCETVQVNAGPEMVGCPGPYPPTAGDEGRYCLLLNNLGTELGTCDFVYEVENGSGAATLTKINSTTVDMRFLQAGTITINVTAINCTNAHNGTSFEIEVTIGN